MQQYGVHVYHTYGLDFGLRWEDGVVRDLRQDYADMHGWEEMVSNVAEYYHNLPEEQRQQCNLWGGSYGHAGALLYYADKYNLPKDVTSFNGSFTLCLYSSNLADNNTKIHNI